MEAAALRAFDPASAKDAVKLYTPWLEKKSFSDNLQRAAADGLAKTKDKAAFAPLLGLAKRGNPRVIRMTALNNLHRMADESWAPPEEKQLVVEAFTACLDDEGVGAKRIAISGLHDLGKTAASALPALTRVAEKDTDANIKAQAKRAAEKIRKDVEKAAAAKKAA